jgi:hypothetical protein
MGVVCIHFTNVMYGYIYTNIMYVYIYICNTLYICIYSDQRPAVCMYIRMYVIRICIYICNLYIIYAYKYTSIIGLQ